jgi:hypothetical protein
VHSCTGGGGGGGGLLIYVKLNVIIFSCELRVQITYCVIAFICGFEDNVMYMNSKTVMSSTWHNSQDTHNLESKK